MLLQRISFKDIHIMVDIGLRSYIHGWHINANLLNNTQGCGDVKDQTMNASHCVLAHQRQHSNHSITRLRTTLPSIVFKCSLVKRADYQPGLQLVWHPARLDRVVSILCLRIRTVELFIYSSGRDHFRSLFSCPSQAGNQMCGLHKILCRFCQMLKTFWKNKKYKCFFQRKKKLAS